MKATGLTVFHFSSLALGALASRSSLRRLTECSNDADCASFGNNYCCSQWGYCGTGEPWCPPAGSCSSDADCAPSHCCSQYGYCGTGYDYCGPCSTDADCASYGSNHCCSQYGYCGIGGDYCTTSSPPPTPYPSTPSPTVNPTMRPTPMPMPPPGNGTTSTIIGYYASWQWYDRDKLAKPTNMDFSKLQRVNFAFFQTDTNGSIWGTDAWADSQVLFGPTDWNPPPGAQTYCSWDSASSKSCKEHKYDEGLISRAHTAGAEVYPSFGGWTLSHTFPALAASDTARKNFANKCVELIEDYDFDGIDIDWEYPGYTPHSGTAADMANYNRLLGDVRAKLDDLTNQTGKVYGLTAALPCGPDHIANIDVAYVAGILSEVNLMTYDFHGAWDPTTGVNSPIYEQGWGPANLSVHDCVEAWVAAGASRSKINIGVPFYGRSFQGATGLNQAHGGADTGNWGVGGVPMYYDIVDKLPNMTSVRHEQTDTQYAYFGGGGLVSFDDRRAVCDKTEYAVQNGLNGFIIWELSGDLMQDLSTPLLDVINEKLANPNLQCSVQ